MMLIMNNLGGAKIKFRKGPIIVAETMDFVRDAPPRYVGESHQWLKVVVQMAPDGFKLIALKETGPNVVFLKHGDVRLLQQLSGLNGQGEGTFQRRELSIDLGIGRPCRLP